MFGLDLPHPFNKIGDGPEGPEVRTIADKLKRIIDCEILEILTDDRNKLDSITLPTKITNVSSYGKKILFTLQNDFVIIFSLGMTGRLTYQQGSHTRAMLRLYNFNLYFDDTRCMGSINIIPYQHIPLYFSNLGPDLLQHALDISTWIPLNTWFEIFYNRKGTICQVLMDQSLIAGIGSYLKAEILYTAEIQPDRLASSLSKDEWNNVRIFAHKIIAISYAYGGFTIESFISPDGEYGKYPAMVYGKKIDPLGNQVIRTKTKDGRNTYWVPSIQK